MSNFSEVAYLNTLIGNPQGVRNVPDWEALERQFGLIAEEFKELGKAIQERNLGQVRDGGCDVLVTTYGLFHRAGIDANLDMQEVKGSNLSKFCVSTEEALLTAQKYEALGLEVMFRYPADGIIAVVSAKDQIGTDGKVYPKGKLLKGINFYEPKFH